MKGGTLIIGKYDIHAIETGTFWLDGGAMFGVVPWVFWSKMNPADEKQRVELAARCLLIQGIGRTILVDDGNGTKWSDKLRNIYGFDNSKADLLSSLKKFGVSCKDVTDVILTHLHFDLAGGSNMLVDSKLEVTFPNARFYIQKGQWEHSQHPTEKDHASYFSDDFQLLDENKMLELVDGDVQLFPGIEVLTMQGHTNSLQLLKLSDDTTTLLFCSDLIPFTAHIPYPYITGYDLRPLETLAEKKHILPQASEEQWILFLEHDPKVHAVTIKPATKGFTADRSVMIP